MAKETAPSTGGRGSGGVGRIATGASEGGRRGPSLTTFFQESRAELRKVTWPTRQEAMNLTFAVIAMTVAISIFLGIIDTVLNQVITPLIGGK